MNRENKRKTFEKGYYKTHACNDSFTCKVCGRLCTPQNAGSDHRNHCPNCLSSLHVDLEPGDRASDCGGIMDPVAVWVRKGGEWAIIHRCRRCGALSSNRVAADDNPMKLMSIAMKPLCEPPFPLASWFDAFHHSFFQVSSIITTTGFSTTDFSLWPELSRYILVVLMLMGACAGSTGGGLKVSRVLILFKALRNEMQRVVHPRSVKVLRIDGKVQNEALVRNVSMYLVAYVIVMIASTLLVSIDDFSFTTNVTAVISCMNNIGPGIDIVGPMGNFSGFSWFSKLVLSADMIIGRLEIFPVLALFSPSLWKRCN